MITSDQAVDLIHYMVSVCDYTPPKLLLKTWKKEAIQRLGAWYSYGVVEKVVKETIHSSERIAYYRWPSLQEFWATASRLGYHRKGSITSQSSQRDESKLKAGTKAHFRLWMRTHMADLFSKKHHGVYMEYCQSQYSSNGDGGRLAREIEDQIYHHVYVKIFGYPNNPVKNPDTRRKAIAEMRQR